jgi:hypothetical protein
MMHGAMSVKLETLFDSVSAPVHCGRQAVLDASKKVNVYLMKT